MQDQETSNISMLSVPNTYIKIIREERIKIIGTNHSSFSLEKTDFGAVNTLSIDVSWIFNSITADAQSATEVVTSTIDSVNKLIAAREFDLLGRAIAAVDVGNAGRHMLLALARASYPVRSKISNWSSYIEKINCRFIELGLDADRLLRGLTA
ncbi:MAG: hypothetical protein K2P80_08105 [Beijerinckiaceae bacterium]|nr:hypothetical protein [Beijerinckiaceae bacterium]